MTELGFSVEQEKVADMMQMMGQKMLFYPGFPEEAEQALSVELIMEESKELTCAILRKDLVGVADGLGDLLVVLMGAANRFGIPMKPVFEEIHRSNMSKKWPDGTPNTVKYSPSGKYLKPDTYSPADLGSVLQQYVDWQEEKTNV